MGRSSVTAGRIVMIRSIGYKLNENKNKNRHFLWHPKVFAVRSQRRFVEAQAIGIFVVCLFMSPRFRVKSKILLMLNTLPSLAGLLKR